MTHCLVEARIGNIATDSPSNVLTDLLVKNLEFAKELESVYQTRCKSALPGCSQSNYGSYVSEFSNPFCHKSKEFVNHNCSTNENDTCASLFSYTESTVVLPKVIADGKDGNPTGPQVSLTTTKNKILASIHHHRS